MRTCKICKRVLPAILVEKQICTDCKNRKTTFCPCCGKPQFSYEKGGNENGNTLLERT